jgi:pyrimidine-nucleoside phosphorylase
VLPASLIAAKRDRRELTDEQIAGFIRGYADGSIPDYQMAAMAMAIFLNGMNARETATLTASMLNSGTRLAWPDDGIPRVDKHSTGGIGDKTSLILAPLLATCDVQVPMLSGRGLGPTGGTLDKLEAIPGFRTNLSLSEITQLTQSVGCVITGASHELAPADQKLYALRDVTATVPSVPLITASIMSKKLAESPDALILDVKFGSGAFMKSREQATVLAESLVATGQRMNVRTAALLTDMNQPLGRMCGNAVEVIESLDVLNNAGPADVRELTLELAAEVLVLSGRCASSTEARVLAERKLADGSARERFDRMVAAQGGSPTATLTVAPACDVISPRAGYVCAIDTEALGIAIIELGGGRRRKDDQIDHSVGLEMLVRIGDRVDAGQPLMKLFTRDPDRVRTNVITAIMIQDAPASSGLLIATRIESSL